MSVSHPRKFIAKSQLSNFLKPCQESEIKKFMALSISALVLIKIRGPLLANFLNPHSSRLLTTKNATFLYLLAHPSVEIINELHFCKPRPKWALFQKKKRMENKIPMPQLQHSNNCNLNKMVKRNLKLHHLMKLFLIKQRVRSHLKKIPIKRKRQVRSSPWLMLFMLRGSKKKILNLI